MHRRENLNARSWQLVLSAFDQQALQATLEFAQVLHARDDFLAGIAALFETHATQRLQIDHLRDEQLASAAEYLADAGANLVQQPAFDRRFLKLRAQARADLLGVGAWGPEIGRASGRERVCEYV